MKKRCSLLLLTLSALAAQAQTISTENKAANVAAFAKLYGYVRYFHPAQEASTLNWEKFVYTGIKEVENAASAKILTQKLNALFNPIAPAVLIYTNTAPQKFDIRRLSPPSISGLKPVSWQHYGMGISGGLYNSVRTNTTMTVPDPKRANFGTATSAINVQPYRGKKFRLRSSMKAEVTRGQGQMWARVDAENNRMGFFDNMDSRPVTLNKWKAYEISGTVDADAKSLVFGAFLSGLGKLWVDQFQLEVEENNKWLPVAIANSSFEEDPNEIKG